MNEKAQSVQPMRLTERVVQALANYYEADPTGISPLHQWINSDALDDLFAPRSTGEFRQNGSVSFTYQDVIVTVESKGDVSIHPSA